MRYDPPDLKQENVPSLRETTQLDQKESKCPICEKSLTLATMCYVRTVPKAFDYTCLLEYVQKHNKCPITGYPLTATDIRRIYFS